MIFSDGECPVCKTEKLHLNTSDLVECPSCHLQFMILGPYLTLIPILGKGKFRFEDSEMASMSGVVVVKSLVDNSYPDTENIFKNDKDLEEYAKILYLKKINSSTISLWQKFRDNFKNYLSNVSKKRLKEVAVSKSERTSFYQKDVMPYIADKIGLVHGKEEFHVDYVMSIEKNDILIPQIYIESENEFNLATHEIKKLCSLNTELRVLITVFEKNKINDIYKNLRHWQNLIETYKKINKEHFAGTIAVIICQITENKIEYYSCAFWDDGDISYPLDSFISIDLE